jgi:Type VI secretion system VasI, EvfG, VC_A0118
MATIRALVTIGFLVTLGSEASIAMSLQDVSAEVKSCKAIVDDKERLKCFDRLFSETSKPQNGQEEKQAGNWSMEESKSAPDGSSQVVAANLVGDTVLILRCKDQTAEAAFSTKYNWLGSRSVLS